MMGMSIPKDEHETYIRLNRIVMMINSGLLSLGFNLKTRDETRIQQIMDNVSILTTDYANFIMSEADKAYHIAENIMHIEPGIELIVVRDILVSLYMNMIKALRSDPDYIRTNNNPILLEDIDSFSMKIHRALYEKFI